MLPGSGHHGENYPGKFLKYVRKDLSMTFPTSFTTLYLSKDY